MDPINLLYVAVVAVACGLAAIAIRAPRALWTKLGALACAMLLIPSAYAGYVELMGRPKPVSMEWAMTGKAPPTVLAARMQEPTAIYVWLQFENRPEPRAYRLPWNLETAKQLQQAMRDAAASGAAARMRQQPSDSGDDDQQPMFYAEPQAPLPPKTAGG